jgi:Holliday junction DNA helicase RuvA
MIAFLSGKVIAYTDGRVILKIPSGEGYILSVPSHKNYLQNENLEFFVLAITRENGTELFGFENLEDRNWAEKLTKVSGIGAKTATQIVYQLGVNKIQSAIVRGDPEPLIEVKGLGVKSAKKIVLELKGSTTDLSLMENAGKNTQFAIEFTDTLSGLGYKRSEIVSLITKLKKVEAWHENDLVGTVKSALELLGRR